MSVVGVVGAGFMGSGIAESAAAAGKHVVLYEPEEAPLERSRHKLAASLAKAVARGKRSEQDAAALTDRVQLYDASGGPSQRRGRDRGGRRESRDQGRAVCADGRELAGRAVPGLEHVLDPDRRTRRAHGASGARARFALLLPGAGDEARRGRRRARHLRADACRAELFAGEIGKQAIRTKDRSGFVVNMPT